LCYRVEASGRGLLLGKAAEGCRFARHPPRIDANCGDHSLQADLWGLISSRHFDDMPTTRPSDFPEPDFWLASAGARPDTYRAALTAAGRHRGAAESRGQDYVLLGDFTLPTC
jgi:hypothetical protein